jgi:hypothetical protein
MTIDEYKQQYPIDAVFVQTDDVERNMTAEEYNEWVERCVYNINHPLPGNE